MKLTRIDAYAVLTGAVVVAGWFAYSSAVKEAIPATEWFSVRNISVPDFVKGEDPAVIYDREVKQPFSGTWNVEVHPVSAAVDYPVCTGSGTNLYKPNEALPEKGVTLSWLVGRVCNLSEGQYNLEVNYELRPRGYPAKQYSATSNIFRVLPEGAQLYIEPEQVQQLEKAQELLESPMMKEQMQ